MSDVISINTIILYCSVVIFSSMFAALACRNTYRSGISCRKNRLHIDRVMYSLSFLLCWGLIAFSKCGKDYFVYRNMFLDATSMSNVILRYGIESGYAFINYIIRMVTSNAEVFFAILAFFFVFPVYHTLYKMRAFVNPAWGVFVFTTVFFFQAMNLRRIYLAAALMFWATSFLIDKQYSRYILLLIACVFIHTSAIIMVAPLIYDLFVGKKISKYTLIILSAVFIIAVYYFKDMFFSFAITDRYANYGVQSGGIGLLQIVYHIPLVYVLMKHKSESEMEIRYRNIGFIYILMSFAVGIFGYFVTMIGRAFVYFIFPFVLAPSYYSKQYIGHENSRHLVLTSRKVWKLVFLVYFIMRLMLYFSEYLFLDGIMPYQDIFLNTF